MIFKISDQGGGMPKSVQKEAAAETSGFWEGLLGADRWEETRLRLRRVALDTKKKV